MEKLDLTFRVGDKIKFDRVETNTREAYVAQHGMPGEITYLDGDIATVRWKHGPRYDDYTQSEIPLKNIKLACHTHGAPFERIVLDEDAAYKDGYHSGLAIGLTDQFYQAGGPGGCKLGDMCRHYAQHDEFDQRNNAAWKRGWRIGQERARMKKPLDFTQPLRRVKDHKPVHYVGPLTPEGEQHIVNLATTAGPPPAFDGGGTMRIDNYGSQGSGVYGVVIENVPPRSVQYTAVFPSGAFNGPWMSREVGWSQNPSANHLIQIDYEGDEVIGVGVLKRKP